MSRNNRVFRYEDKLDGVVFHKGLMLCETYYGEDGKPHSRTDHEIASSIGCETDEECLDEMISVLERQIKALQKTKAGEISILDDEFNDVSE